MIDSIEIIIESDISGSVTYGDITDRIIAVSELHEAGESSPGEYLISQFNFKINNNDGWYDTIFKNYFYEDRLLSGNDDTIINIYVDNNLIWVGYLKTIPKVDFVRDLVDFEFTNILDKIKDVNIPYNLGDGAANWIRNSDSQGIIVDGLDLISTNEIDGSLFYPEDIVNYALLASDYMSISNNTHPYYPPSWLQSDYQASGFNFRTILKNTLNVFRCWFALNDGKMRLLDKNGGTRTPETITNDQILDYKPYLNYHKYNKIIMQAANLGVYSEFTGAEDELILDAAYYNKVIVDPSYDWVGTVDDLSAKMNYDYYKVQKPGMILLVDGLIHFIGNVYSLPTNISEYTNYVCKELWRNFQDKTTELLLAPKITTLQYSY